MDCDKFAIGSFTLGDASHVYTPGQSGQPTRPCYPDRFIRPVNEAIFGYSRPIEADIFTRAQIAFRRTLSGAVLGVDSTSNPSVFSFPTPRSSPLALDTVRVCTVAEPLITVSGPGSHKVLDLPGIAGGRAGLSRPLAILDDRTFVIALANRVYTYNALAGEARDIHAIVCGEGREDSERTLSHVAVINPNAGEFVASDTTGRLYHMHARHDVLEESVGDGDALVRLAATDRSTLFVGTETGRVLLKDTRDFEHTNGFSLHHRVSALSLCKGSPLFAAGSQNSVRIYDIRRLSDPVAKLTYAGRDEVSALAWGTNLLSKRLMVAFGGKTPVITVNDAMGCLQQRCAQKTFGVVTSILTTCTDAFITMRKNPEGKSTVVWEYGSSEGLSCTQIGATYEGRAVTPTSAVLGKNEDFMVTVFSEQEALRISPLYKGVAQAPHTTPDRNVYHYSLR